MLAKEHLERLKIYGAFLAGFAVMNAAAMLVAGLPAVPAALLTAAAVLLTLFVLQRRLFREPIKTAPASIGLKKVSLRLLIPGLVVSTALLLCYLPAGWLLHTTIVPAENWQTNLVAVFLTGGIAEEALFRGFLFGHLRQRMSFRRAALASMLVFTLAHLLMFTYMPWPIALLSTLLAISTSVPLAYLYERADNSIWGAALVHAAIRTIGMVFTAHNGYTALASAWIIACMAVPYVVLAFDRDFRGIWKRREGAL